MATAADVLFTDLERFVAGYGVEVRTREMDVESPGEFDGPSITINPVHDREALSYYLAHSFGSIYQWSTAFDRAKTTFDELRHAKRRRIVDQAGFEQALGGWRLFEQTSSDHAVWVLATVGHPEAIDPYTVFFRADLDAMTIFHRMGKEPKWSSFFAEWKRLVERGSIKVDPFDATPILPFTPVRIENQEVVQEHD